MRIFYDPNDYNTNVDEDRELLQIYKVFHDIDPVMSEEREGSEWIIRYELDKQAMMDKNITMEMIYFRINSTYGDDISCVYSDYNSSKLIFRVRIMKLKKADSEKYNDLNTLKAFGNAMREKVIIKGISGINSVSMYKNQNHFITKNMSYEQKDEWLLDTNGVNLLEILRQPGVDPQTVSNDIYEMYEIFVLVLMQYAYERN